MRQDRSNLCGRTAYGLMCAVVSRNAQAAAGRVFVMLCQRRRHVRCGREYGPHRTLAGNRPEQLAAHRRHAQAVLQAQHPCGVRCCNLA